MVHLQAPDYSVPWADEEFISEFGPIEGRKCFQIMHGRDKPCEKCPTFKVFETKEAVISEWHSFNGHTYMTVVEPLPYGVPLLIEFVVELYLPIQSSDQQPPIQLYGSEENLPLNRAHKWRLQ